MQNNGLNHQITGSLKTKLKNSNFFILLPMIFFTCIIILYASAIFSSYRKSYHKLKDDCFEDRKIPDDSVDERVRLLQNI